MALNGIFTTTSSTGSGYTYKVEWSAVQSIANNTSTITIKHYLVCGTGWSLNIVSNKNSYSQIDLGTAVYYSPPSINTAGNKTISLGTTSHIVSHDVDGSKSFSLKCIFGSTYLGNPTINQSNITLDPIPRASSISAVTSSVSVNGVNAVSVNINRASSSFTHTLIFKSPNNFYSQTYTGVATSQSFVIPQTWLNSLPSSTSGTASVTLVTFNGNTQVGNNETSYFNISVPDNIVPSIDLLTMTRNELNDNSGWNLYIKGYTGTKATVGTTEGAYGSSIVSVDISGGGYKVHSTSVFDGLELITGVLNNVGNNVFVATVTDSRGRTATKTATIVVTDYASPKLNYIETYRCNLEGVMSDDGMYIKALADCSINSNGTCSLTIYYKKSTDTEFSNNNLTNNTGSIIGDGEISTDSSYDVYYECSDGFKTTKTTVITVPSSSSIMDVLSDGTGVAFGGSAETPNAVEVKNGWDLIVDEEKVLTEKNYGINGELAITSTNQQPQRTGTWELIGKSFTNQSVSKSYNTTNANVTVVGVISDDCIRFRFSIQTKVAITDTTMTLCQVDLSDFGIDEDYAYGYFGMIGTSDDANSVVFFDFSATGVLTTSDSVPNDIAAGSNSYATIIVNTPYDRKLDAFCDKFFWKRIS